MNSNNFYIHHKNLKHNQKLAVDEIYGPVLVIAGPGTGKTQVLALRIANILLKTDTDPRSILCLTFTESATASMRNRLRKFIGNNAYKIAIHTFHSFCNEIIQQNLDMFNFKKNFIQIDDLNRIKVIHKIIDDINSLRFTQNDSSDQFYKLIPRNDKYFYTKEILSAIQKIKAEGITPSEFKKIAEEEYTFLNENIQLNRNNQPSVEWKNEVEKAKKYIELCAIYSKYQEYLEELMFYDYEDMLIKVIDMFNNNPDFLSQFQERYLFILVDEYQDTNGAQNKIIKLLCSYDENPNIFAVGDDDQSIYRFQGANLSNILEFSSYFKNTKIITLNDNFRSSQTILDASYEIIKNNKNRIENLIPDITKKLTSHSNYSEQKIKYYEFQDNLSENDFLLNEVKRLKESGVEYKEIAILYRNHKDSIDIIDYFVRNNIPVKVLAGDNIFQKKIVVEFLNLLRLVEYPAEDKDVLFFKVLSSNFLKIPSIDIFYLTKLYNDIQIDQIDNKYSQNIAKLIQERFIKKIDFCELLIQEDVLKSLNLVSIQALIEFKNNLLDWIKNKNSISLVDLILDIANQSGFTKYLISENKNIEDQNAFLTFVEFAKQQNTINSDITLSEFLKDIDKAIEENLSIQQRELDTDIDGVNFMTVHKSKGLEFKYVYLVKFSKNSWVSGGNKKSIKLPNKMFYVKDTSIESEEEDVIRLFYVALTRAKAEIHITFSKLVENNEKQENPLVYLIPDKYIEKVNTEIYQVENKERTVRLLASNKNFNVQEKEFLKSLVSNLRISASSLNAFIECPLKFLYENLIGIPQKHNKYLIIGEAIHKGLEIQNKNLKIGKNTTLEELEQSINNLINKMPILKNHKIEYAKDAFLILKKFLEIELKENLNKIAEVEYNFGYKNILFEIPNQDPVILTGKIDKLEFLDKNNLEVRIVDYKTGKIKTKNEILGLTKLYKDNKNEFRQLVFYKLLSELDPKFGLFKNHLFIGKYKVVDIQIKYVNLEEDKKIKFYSFDIGDNEIKEVKDLIIDVVMSIRSLDFYGNSTFKLCGECDYCRLN